MSERLDVFLGLEARDYIQGAKQAASATDSITDAAGKQATGLGGLVKSYGKVAGAAAVVGVAGKQVIDFGKEALRAFSDLEESINAVEVGFGEGATVIKAFGETAAEQVGLSNAAFNQMSVTTGALLSNFIDDERAAAEETIRLTQRAADMASVFNTSVPDALNAVQAAIRGELEPARKFGVMLDDMTIRSHAVEMGLAATTSEVDRQAKGLAALDLIYEQTANTAGDFQSTADGMANKQRILAAQFEDTQAVIGGALAPAYEALLDVGAELLPLLSNLAPGIAWVASELADMVGFVGDAVGAVGWFADTVGNAWSEIAGALGSDAANRANAIREAIDSQAGALQDLADARAAVRDAEVGTDQHSRLQAEAAERETVAVNGLRDALAHLVRTQQASPDAIAEVTRAFGLSAEQQALAMGDILTGSMELTDFQRTHFQAAMLDSVVAMDISGVALADLIDKYGLAAVAAEQGIDPIQDMDDARIAEANAIDAAREAQLNEILVRARSAASRPREIEALATATEFYGHYVTRLNEVEAAQEAANSALVTWMNRNAEAASPMLRLFNAQKRLTDAQGKYEDALAGGTGEAAAQHAALAGLIEAQAAYESAVYEAVGSTDESIRALERFGETLGIEGDELQAFIDSIGTLPTTVGVGIHTTYTSEGDPPDTSGTGGTGTGSGSGGSSGGGGGSGGGRPIANNVAMDTGFNTVNSVGTDFATPVTTVPQSTTVNIYVESEGDTVSDVSTALAMAGLAEDLSFIGSPTVGNI